MALVRIDWVLTELEQTGREQRQLPDFQRGASMRPNITRPIEYQLNARLLAVMGHQHSPVYAYIRALLDAAECWLASTAAATRWSTKIPLACAYGPGCSDRRSNRARWKPIAKDLLRSS